MGTTIRSGPLEMVSSTTPPGATYPPPPGLEVITRPSGTSSLNTLVTIFVVNFMDLSEVAASAAESPTTEGIPICEPGPKNWYQPPPTSAISMKRAMTRFRLTREDVLRLRRTGVVVELFLATVSSFFTFLPLSDFFESSWMGISNSKLSWRRAGSNS